MRGNKKDLIDRIQLHETNQHVHASICDRERERENLYTRNMIRQIQDDEYEESLKQDKLHVRESCIERFDSIQELPEEEEKEEDKLSPRSLREKRLAFFETKCSN